MTLLGLALAAWPCPARTGWNGGLEAGAEHDDNATRAIFDSDRKSETAATLRVDGDRRYRLTTNGELVLQPSVEGWIASRAEDLTHVDPGVALTWRTKTRLGADAPWVSVRLGTKWQDFRSDVRRGWLHTGELRLGRPVGRRWTVEGALELSRRDARAQPFDQQAWAVVLDADVAVSGATLLYASYRYRDGDVTSTATPAAIDPRVQTILDRSTARVPDDAYPGRIAYRLDATGHALRAGVNCGLGPDSSVDVAYEYERTSAGGGLDYRNRRMRASWVTRF